MNRWLLAAAIAIACPGIVQAGTVTFTFTPDQAILTRPAQPDRYFDGPLTTFSGILSGVEEGDNFSFDLFATITSAAYDGQLGSGYRLEQLVGTSPSLTVTNGVVTFANAAFRRGTPDQAFQLSAPGGDYLTGSQYQDADGARYIGFLTDNAGLKFGTLTQSAVPEPAAWMTMIAGVGVSGAMLRRRRKRGAAGRRVALG